MAIFLTALAAQLKQRWRPASSDGDLDALRLAAHTAGGSEGIGGETPLASRPHLLETAPQDRQPDASLKISYAYM